MIDLGLEREEMPSRRKDCEQSISEVPGTGNHNAHISH